MRKLIPVLLLLLNPAAFADRFDSWPAACAKAQEVVEEGDLIFLDMPDYVFRNVAAATNSWTSHVGVVFKNERGEFVVAESTIPLSREIPLCDFLSHSTEHRFEIRRLRRGLSADEVNHMHEVARGMMGRLYGLGFDFDSSLLYCSKFAYLVYRSIGVEVGRVETFRDLLARNPTASLTLWKFWFLGSIPWERRTITPASQLEDAQFTTVLEGN